MISIIILNTIVNTIRIKKIQKKAPLSGGFLLVDDSIRFTIERNLSDVLKFYSSNLNRFTKVRLC